MSKKKNYKNIMTSSGNIPVVASAIVLIAFIAGLLLGSLVVAKSSNSGSVSVAGSFIDGWNAAKIKLKSVNFPGAMFGEVKNLSGQVKSVDGNKIVFSSPLVNPLWDSSLQTRTVVASNDTTITIRTQLSPEKSQANQQAGQGKVAALRADLETLNAKLVKCSPSETATSTCNQTRQKVNSLQAEMMTAQVLMMSMFNEATGTLSDIAVGDNISVISIQDISEKAQFAAKQIIITKNSAPAALPATKPDAPISR